MDSFLEQVAKGIVERVEWKQLSKTTLVLPSHRAGVVLKDALLRLQREQGLPAVWAPDVKTLQQFQDLLSPLYAEEELQTIIRLYRHYRRLNEGDTDLMPLDMFYGWGRQMLADFTNVDASMTAQEVPNFFDNAIAANDLEALDIDEEVRKRLLHLMNPAATHSSDSIFKRYEKIWSQLYTLYTDLRSEMLAVHKGYAGMRQRAVIEQWDTPYVQNQIAGRTIVFVGFNYLLPVERELMELLKAQGQAMFFWDYVDGFETNEKAFYFAKKNAERLGAAFNGERLAVSGKPVTVMACSSKESQAQYVHRWLEVNYTAKGQKVGVVICDETMLESVIYALPAITLPGQDAPEPVNITKGFPLRNTAIYAKVVGWLYDRQRGEAETIVSPELIDETIKLIDERIELRDVESGESLSWQELLILESEYQMRKVLHQIRQIVELGIEGMPFTLKLLRLLLRRVAENVTMPFHGEPVTDIQVMGVLETRLMDFDKLLILNVEEGVIPQKQHDNSFIPYYLRKAYSMQTPDEKATIYAYNFFRLLSRTSHATMLYSTTEGSEGSKGMSRFLMQIMANEKEFAVTKKELVEPSVLTEIDEERLGTSGTAMIDTLTLQDGVYRKADGKPYRLSPSALNTYINCPRQFCMKYIQHLPDREEKETIFQSHTLGTMVHNAIEWLYKTYLEVDNKTPKPVKPEVLDRIMGDDSIIAQAIEQAYIQANKDWAYFHQGETNHYVQAEHQMEQSVIETFIGHILQHDRQQAAEQGLDICMLEADQYFDVQVGKGQISVGGRLDRLDRIGRGEEQRMRVVDYKSGTYDSGDLSTKFINVMAPAKRYIRQVLIYSETIQTKLPIEPNLFFCSCDMRNISTTLSIDQKPLKDYRAIQEDFMEALTAKVQELMTTTVFPPCESSKCSPHCPFLDRCGRKVIKHE